MVDKEIIKRNFSRHARYYDKYSTVQNLSALRLISKIERSLFDRILDIGCGTGNYTKLLSNKFPSAEIKALDISSGMIDVAKDKFQNGFVEFIEGDGEAFDFDEKFDLITSNACFQWFSDLESALVKYRMLLKKDGIILFSILGFLTLYELDTCLKELFREDTSINSSNFINKNRLDEILERNFNKACVEEEIFREEYSSLWELLNRIKHTGTRGYGINNKSLLRSQIIELERIYRKKFKRLTATYQIFYCKAVK